MTAAAGLPRLSDATHCVSARCRRCTFATDTMRPDAAMNAIIAIHPYKASGLWVFDDEKVGLVQEPFVSGADDIIERLACGLDDPEKGFSLLFSATPFPGHHTVFEWRRADMGGNWYYSPQLDAEGWLCPALFKYFDSAPQRIYAQFKSRQPATLR